MMRTKSTIDYKKWDIMLVPFPFTDLSTNKKRPALIISPDSYNTLFDIVVLFITSNISSAERPGDYLISNWEEASLPKPSMIRMKFATIDKSIIIRKLGKLTPDDVNGFNKVLTKFLTT